MRGKALLAVGRLLNGVLGSDEDRHIATWSSVKVVDSGPGLLLHVVKPFQGL
jgi:hypothetical protein